MLGSYSLYFLPSKYLDSFIKVVRRRIKGMIMAGKQYSLDSRMDIVSTMHATSNRESVEEDDKGREKINSVS